MVNTIFDPSPQSTIDLERASPQCGNLTREAWIRTKYADKTFVQSFTNLHIQPLENNSLQILDRHSTLTSDTKDPLHLLITHPNNLLHEACSRGDLAMILYAIALNADLNSVIDKINFFDSVTEQKDIHHGFTPLIKAVNNCSTPAVELLLLNGAKINSCDFRGRTALHHATSLKSLKMVCLLLKRGADPLCVDKNDEDPIQIATENCQANIVTILRVAKMNNDLKEQDMAYSGDPMFAEMLKDLLRVEEEEEAAREVAKITD